MNSEQQYLDLFTANRELIDRNSAAAMNALREQAFADFARLGFPTRKVERYKYTDVAEAFAPDYGVNLKRVEFAVNPYEAFRCDVPNLSTSLYFMLNDAFWEKALPSAALPPGVVVCSLRRAAQEFPEKVEACYGRLARTGKDALNALNTMLAQDGFVLYVPKGIVVERPIQVINLLRSSVDFMLNRRVLVKAFLWYGLMGAVVSMAVAPVGIQSCSNPSPFLGGSDGESDQELRARVMDTFQRLPNGANAAFYEQGALSFDEVAAASVLPRNRGVGTVDVVVAAGSGQPDEELLEKLEDYFQTRREIAVDVQVLAPEEVGVTLSVQVKAKDGWDGSEVRTGVKNALQSWFSGERLAQDVLLAQLGSLIYGCEGVANYKIVSPAADVAIGADQLPVLSSISVEAMT